MSSSESESSKNSDDNKNEEEPKEEKTWTSAKAKERANRLLSDKKLMLNTMELLDEEKQTILTEVLRCYVCLEVPKGKQVKICKEGHHCCFTCHKKIKFCGICRGRLLQGRNFAVEQLVSKLGPILGISKHELPPQEPKNLPPGSYLCLHHCHAKVPAFQMLPHLRVRHPNTFLENVRSNAYSERFSFRVKIVFAENKKYVWSVHVSDMGLFTLELSFIGLDLFGCLRMLGTEETSSLFRYQLVVSLGEKDSECLAEFSVTNCPVWSYLTEVRDMKNRKNCLNVSAEHLQEYVKLGDLLGVFICIWEKKERKKEMETERETEERVVPTLASMPEKDMNFESDRRKQRNRNRRMRRARKRLRLSVDEIIHLFQEDAAL